MSKARLPSSYPLKDRATFTDENSDKHRDDQRTEEASTHPSSYLVRNSQSGFDPVWLLKTQCEGMKASPTSLYAPLPNLQGLEACAEAIRRPALYHTQPTPDQSQHYLTNTSPS